jgi:saccharopine dehydrogenase (NAD+, L-lysine-forming)
MKIIYLRKELNINEHRTPITPKDIGKLIFNKFVVYVESSNTRVYSDEDFKKYGAIITKEHWSNFNGLIIGLKEIDNLNLLKNHTHIYFSHSYLHQNNSEKILTSFLNSKSIIYDLEFFIDENSNRLLTFSYWAGLVGTILAIMQYYNKINKLSNINNLKSWKTLLHLYSDLNIINFDNSVKIAIIGLNGNCSQGAQYILDYCNFEYDCFDKNSDKTKLIDYDIVINCIKLNVDSKEIWFNSNTKFYKNIVISDVSCDYTKYNNPINIYNNCTTWSEPVYSYNKYVDIIAIDNLPSLIPKESSDEFSSKLLKLILDYENDEKKYWLFNKKIFDNKIKELIIS